MAQSNPDSDGATQVALGDVSYDDEHTIPEVNDSRATADIDCAEDLYECSIGDTIWVKGTEYVVVERGGYFSTHLLVVAEDGTQGHLIGGGLPRTSTAGVMWSADTPDEKAGFSSELLISKFKHVYRLERDRIDRVHDWTPDTPQRECPACDSGMSGRPIRIERQASKAVEIRYCVNTDCHHVYRFAREFPSGDERTVILERSSMGASPKPTYVSGVFRAEEQDDLKFPVETNDGRDDGFWTAEEIAAFVNPKMCGIDRDGVVSIEEQTRRPGLEITWKDEPGYKADMQVTFREVTEHDPPQYDLNLQRLNYRADLSLFIADE